LVRLGYAPNPHCPVCHGGGFVHPRVDNKVLYDKTKVCAEPECLQESYEHYKQTGKWLKVKGLAEIENTFENFVHIGGTEAAFEAFQQLANGWTDKPFLLCAGGVGNGKTHLCQAAVARLNQREVKTWYYSVADFFAELKAGMTNNTVEEKIKWAKQAQGLCLDDLGVNYGSMWELARLEEIVDARYREGLTTILTTNRDIKEIPERIVSRFYDPDRSNVVLNSAPDYRRR